MPDDKAHYQRRTLALGSSDGYFYALGKHTGKILWQHDAQADGAFGGFRTTPLLWRGAVITGTTGECGPKTQRAFVYSLDQQTGVLRWKLARSATSSVFVNVDEYDPAGPLLFGSNNGEWLSISANDGKIN